MKNIKSYRWKESTGIRTEGFPAQAFLFSLFLTLLLSFTGCISDPEIPEQEGIPSPTSGVIVVNQGIWRGDNAGLTLYDINLDRAYTDWFAQQNSGLRLGDTGNEIILWKDQAYVAISESATIEVISIPGGTSIGRIHLPSGTFPQHLLILNDSTGWVSCLDADIVYRFNPRDLTLGEGVPVGPAPEGIAALGNRLFVANSGLGALRATEPGAGEIWVIDQNSLEVIGKIAVGGNLRDMEYFPTTGNLYVFNGAALPDTSGSGLVEIDPLTLNIRRRWSVSGAWEVGFDERRGQSYVIAQEGILRIDLLESSLVSATPDPVDFISTEFSTLNEEVPHSIAISPANGNLLVGIARGYYSAPGRVDRYDREGKFLGSFETGLNPTAFGFIQ